MKPNRTAFHLPVFALLSVSLLAFVFTAGACIESWRWTGSRPIQNAHLPSPKNDTVSNAENPEPDGGIETTAAPGDSSESSVEQEEDAMEDPSALEALIASKTGSETTADRQTGKQETDPVSRRRDLLPAIVPAARETMKLTSAQCLKQLHHHNVPFEKPDFETPLVETPVLLTGPVNGVRIAPAHAGKTPVHAVMDCRLALAFVETARRAKVLGITDIEFFSIYRPLAHPKETCADGAAGKRCRAQQKRYRKIATAQTSQHRFARAVDIQLLKTEDGETLNVLEDFERRSGKNPCSYAPSTEKAKLLTDFVCALHENHIFNVMLTPNSNKAHRNHFHFDLTPKASWYIVR